MPNIEELLDGTCVAAADLDDDDLYKFVELTDDLTVNAVSGAGDRAYGVLKRAGDTGEAVTVQLSGVSLVRCGSSITAFSAGDLLSVEAGGTVQPHSAGEVAVAIAKEAGDDDQLISAFIISGGDDVSV